MESRTDNANLDLLILCDDNDKLTCTGSETSDAEPRCANDCEEREALTCTRSGATGTKFEQVML